MSTRLFTILAAVLLLAGCSGTHAVSPSSDTDDLAQLNRALRGKIATVSMVDGTRFHATGVHVDADSSSWINRKENVIHRVATNDIKEISVVKAGSGALRGAAVGVVGGAALGLVRAATEGDDPEGDIGISKEKKMAIFPPAHAVYATLFTTPIGAMIGKKETYVFEHREPSTASR